MKKNRLAAGALALAVSVTACGCGDQIYEMTEEEEAVIVHYSAHAVSKFNKKQSEGIEDVAVLKALRELREKEAEERRKEQEEEQSKEEQQQEQESPADSGQGETSSDGQDAGPQVEYVSLKKALQLGGGLNAVYRKYELASAYQASQSYMVRANSGNDLLILHVNLRNSGSKTAECDILSKMPAFRLTVNGDLSVSADTTILLNDLGTYQGRIKAGDKARTVLIFQVKKGTVKSIDSMQLEVTVGGTASQVKLV